MKRTGKIFTSAMLILFIVSALFTGVSAEDDKTPCISVKNGYSAENEIAYVTVSLDGELDLAAYTISLYFEPSVLEFVDAYSTTEDGMFYSEIAYKDSVVLVWSDSKNHKFSGDLFTVRFKTKSESNGYDVPLEFGHTVLGNEKMSEIPFETSNGTLHISNAYKWGDVNGDKKTSLADVVALSKFNLNSRAFPLSNTQLINGDADRNKIINSTDCELILKYVKNSIKKER